MSITLTGPGASAAFLLKAHRPEVYRDRYEVKVRERPLIRFVPAMGGVHAEDDA